MINLRKWKQKFMKKKKQNNFSKPVSKMPNEELRHLSQKDSAKSYGQIPTESTRKQFAINSPKIDSGNHYSVEPRVDKKVDKKYSWDSKVDEDDKDEYFDASDYPEMPVKQKDSEDDWYSDKPNEYSGYSYKQNQYNGYSDRHGYSDKQYSDYSYNQNGNNDYKSNQYNNYSDSHGYSDKQNQYNDYSNDNDYFEKPKQCNDFNERKRQIPKYLMSANRVIYQKNYDDIFEMIHHKSEYLADDKRYCEVFSGFLKVHHPKRPFLCPYCDKLNQDRWDLFDHIKDIHGQHYVPNGFWCQKCECPLLNDRSALNFHMGFCRKSQWYEKVRGYPCYF